MSRIYAIREGDGKRILAAIKCDRCGAEVKPNPQIASSGWEKGGQLPDHLPLALHRNREDWIYWDHCPECK